MNLEMGEGGGGGLVSLTTEDCKIIRHLFWKEREERKKEEEREKLTIELRGILGDDSIVPPHRL